MIGQWFKNLRARWTGWRRGYAKGGRVGAATPNPPYWHLDDLPRYSYTLHDLDVVKSKGRNVTAHQLNAALDAPPPGHMGGLCKWDDCLWPDCTVGICPDVHKYFAKQAPRDVVGNPLAEAWRNLP